MLERLALAWGDALLRQLNDGPAAAACAATPLPAEVYTSPERHRAERAAIARSPMPALHASELAAPGSFVTITVNGVPLIVARDGDGALHAVHNACAHRGATVEPRPSGSARALSCGFHGWSYELDGSLRSVSEPGLFSNAPCGRGLRAVGCEERHGIVWITTGEAPAPGRVRAWLGEELDDVFAALGLDRLVLHRSETFPVACNWKLLTDGFLELYHLKYLHRKTIAPYFPANLTLPIAHGEHVGTVIPKNRLVAQLTARPREQWRVLDDVTVPFVLVPGTVLQWQAGHVELFSLRPHPVEPGRTECRLSLLVPAEHAGDRALWDRNWDRVWETIPGEDFAVAEEVQRNIDAGVVDQLQIGANERALFEHLAAVDRLIGASAPLL